MPKVLIPMADYGHDPTEVILPFTVFKEAGFSIVIATENGAPPQLDKMMLEGVTGAMLGASAEVKKLCHSLIDEDCFKQPVAWAHAKFSMDHFDLVFLPGGHEKGVRQLIDSEVIHGHLATFFPKTHRAQGGTKTVAAICHGVQVLAFTPSPSSMDQPFPIDKDGSIELKAEFKSIIHSCATTALPAQLEIFITHATRPFLGDYYKTYGAGTPNVEAYVKFGLVDPDKQFRQGPSWYSPWLSQPFVVVDEGYRYLSARFPPDARRLAEMAVLEVQSVCQA